MNIERRILARVIRLMRQCEIGRIICATILRSLSANMSSVWVTTPSVEFSTARRRIGAALGDLLKDLADGLLRRVNQARAEAQQGAWWVNVASGPR